MKKLKDIFDIDDNTIINDIRTSSQDITPGDLFVCIKGVKEDRHKYIDDAIKKGAAAIVVSKNIKNKSVPIIRVKDTNRILEELCKKFYDYPEEKLEIIGITGTDGKTTTAKILSNMLDAGYIGTLGANYKDYQTEIDNTTPAIEKIYQIFSEFVSRGCKTVVMEVSSEAIFRGRVENLKFDATILTNITEDHLNVHKTLTNYINTKKKLFKNTKDNGICILNSDDQHYKEIQKACSTNVITYAIDNNATLKNIEYKFNIEESEFKVEYKNKKYKFKSKLIGKYNIYNLEACILLLLEKGYTEKEINNKLKRVKRPEGRCEVFRTKKGSYIILDYAHTTNGLTSILSLINEIKQEKVITVTGSAGGREKRKRKEMGKVVTDMSDHVIFTMDDPRYEDPNTIINDMLKKVKKDNYIIEIDRKKAIEQAVIISKKNDIILIAGKGHDQYMLIENKKIAYNDYEEIKKWI